MFLSEVEGIEDLPGLRASSFGKSSYNWLSFLLYQYVNQSKCIWERDAYLSIEDPTNQASYSSNQRVSTMYTLFLDWAS